MNVIFDVITQVVDYNTGDTLRETSSRYEVGIRLFTYHGNNDTPGYSEYQYDLPKGLTDEHEKLITDACDAFVEQGKHEDDN